MVCMKIVHWNLHGRFPSGATPCNSLEGIQGIAWISRLIAFPIWFEAQDALMSLCGLWQVATWSTRNGFIPTAASWKIPDKWRFYSEIHLSMMDLKKKNFAMFDSQRASGRFWRKKWIWTCNKGRMWWIHRISCEHRHTPSTREILCTNPVDILWLYQFGWSGFRRKLDNKMKKWIRRLKYDQPFCFRWTRHGYGSKLGHFFEWSMLKLD